jgi:chromosome segregation ATPase
MATAEATLATLKRQIDELLEARTSELLGRVKSVQEATRRLTALEAEQRKLESQLEPARARLAGADKGNAALKTRVEALDEQLGKLRQMKTEIVGNLKTLRSELE